MKLTGGNLISRSGKLSGKYRNAWNCELNDEDKTITIHFETDVTDVQLVPNVLVQHENYSEEIDYSEIFITELEIQSMNAKLLELENWKIQEVYIEEENIGQHCLSVRWVLSRKFVDGKTITKARLCARGFEEVQDFPTVSPCCSRIGLKSVITLIATEKWEIKSIDVKTAFLQGKEIQRNVYLRPPVEANTRKVWKLRKCVYGLADASRYWYLRV